MPAPANPASAAERVITSADVFRQAFHNSPAMQTVTRVADQMLVEANDSFLRKLGYTREEMIGHRAMQETIWVSPERAVPFRAALFAHGFIRGYEAEIRTKAGQILTVLLSADVVEIGGEPHVVAAGVDITARKETETRLRESETRFRESEALFSTAFLESPILMTIGTLPDGRFVEVNDAFLRALGLTREQTIGRNSVELGLWVEAEDRARFHQAIKDTGSLRNVECRIRHQDGTPRTMQISGEIVDIHRVPHLLTFAIDITQRTRADAELRAAHAQLRQSEERFSKAFRASSAMMAITRIEDGKFLSVNEAFLRGTGYTEAEVLSRSAKDLDLHATLEQRDRFLQQVARHGFMRDFEFVIRTKAGELRTLLASGERIEIDGVPHLLTVGVDITGRKESEAETRRALERELELSQLKNDFVSLVSHEFRTPLEIIMSSVDNLDRYHDRLPPDKRQQLLRTINKSVRRMAGMMEEVLLLGRLDGGGTEYKPAALDLPGFLVRVRDEMESATNRRCPIELEVSRDMGGGCGDEAILRHILTNLLSNAVKYSEAGQPATLAAKREGNVAVIQIRDRGCGIPKEDQQRLFQAFHRGSNVRQIPGTGLGLLIVRRCVDLHGGEIDCESREGQGTVFTVRLPLFGGSS